MPVMERAIDAAASEAGFTGLLTIDTGDERVLAKTYGFAHRALAVPNATTTRFAIASGSKAWTALAVMRLVEDGVMALGDRVRPILKNDLPLIDDGVSLEHLLTHTSGIDDYLDEDGDGDAAEYVLPVPEQVLAETEEFIPVVDGYPQAFVPGERFKYCNGGYIVLALIAERVSGVPFHDLVEREVCDRVALRHTAFLRSDELPADTALGDHFAEGNRTNVLHLPVRGNGGIYTTADELHWFWLALTAGRIVTPWSVEQMLRPRHDVPTKGCGTGWASGSTRPDRRSCSRATTPGCRSARPTTRRPRRRSACSATAPRMRGL